MVEVLTGSRAAPEARNRFQCDYIFAWTMDLFCVKVEQPFDDMYIFAVMRRVITQRTGSGTSSLTKISVSRASVGVTVSMTCLSTVAAVEPTSQHQPDSEVS